MKRTPLRKISERQKEKNIEKAATTKLLHLWMYNLWEDMPREKFCKSCGKRIYGEFSTMYFDHLLEKNLYEELEFEEKNIYFCCGDCHTLKGNGFPTEKHKLAIKEAKKYFEI